MAENILMHQCVHFLFTAQIDHLTFAPPVFRSSFTLESVRAHFFLHSPSSSPLFFFFFPFFPRQGETENRRSKREFIVSLFLSLPASLVAARVVDFRLKPEICSNIRAVMLMGTLRFVQVSPDFFAHSRLTIENTNHAAGNSLHSISIPVMGFSVSWLDDASSKNYNIDEDGIAIPEFLIFFLRFSRNHILLSFFYIMDNLWIILIYN